jgi:hypothetical protein
MPTTPSQTVGPFFAIELPYGDGRYAVPEGTPGAIWLRGRVFDGDGAPVPDALIVLPVTDAVDELPRTCTPMLEPFAPVPLTSTPVALRLTAPLPAVEFTSIPAVVAPVTLSPLTLKPDTPPSVLLACKP